MGRQFSLVEYLPCMQKAEDTQVVVGSNPTRSTSIMVLICEPSNNSNIRLLTNELQDLEPFLLYINAIRSGETREKYQRRLKIFFDFIQLPNLTFQERCNIFVKNSKKNPNFALNNSFRFVVLQKSRLERKEIMVSTIYNYLKPIKLQILLL